MKDELIELLGTNNDNATQNYRRLITFIDATVSQAFKLSGDDRAEFLVKNILNLRDFMSSEIVVNQTKSSIGEVVIELFDKFVEESELDLDQLETLRRKKKELALEEERKRQESILETDQLTSSEKEEE